MLPTGIAFEEHWDEEDEHGGARRTGHRAGTKVRGLHPSGEDSDSGRIRGRHGLHRKHAMRVLRTDATRRHAEGKAGRRIYDDAVRDALVVLWEASDRICGKRLKALMPTLVEAMERHGHLKLGPEIRAGLLAMSAATVDRSLRKVREQAGGRHRRRTAPPSSVRRSIPVRTFSDWDDLPPEFVEADLVAHSGPVTSGSFVQTLVLTDIATGWTECAPLLYREQTPLREVLGEVRIPFELLGFDTDNASRKDAPTACSSTRRCATTAATPGSCSHVADRGARTTRPSSSRRTARWSDASLAPAVWKASRPQQRCRGCTRPRGCASTSSSRADADGHRRGAA